MKRVAICFLLISVTLVDAASAQGKKEQIPERVVIVPTNILLPVVAYQPDSPLQIEEIKFLGFVSGGGGPSYRVRHKGAKPIRSYTIGAWNSAGTGWEVEVPVNGGLFPGQVSSPDGGSEVEVVELTEALRNQLNIKGEMQAIVVFMVVRVEFMDGSVYNNEPLYKALKAHFDKVCP